MIQFTVLMHVFRGRIKGMYEEVLLGIDSKDSLSETVFSWLFLNVRFLYYTQF